MQDESHNRSWYSGTDIAFVHFGKRKGFSYREIAKAMDRSEGGIGQMGHKINSWEKGYYDASPKQQKKMEKAMQLAFQVNSNAQGEQYQFWMKKLLATRNIDYAVVKPEESALEPEVVTETVEVSKTDPIVEEVEAEIVPKFNKPLLSFTIDADAVVAVIKAWRGN